MPVIFAFVGNGIFMGVYYSLQRLCKAKMFNNTLSKIHFWGWQLIIVSAVATLPFGYTTSKEYAEMIVRGLGLGSPYVSPQYDTEKNTVKCDRKSEKFCGAIE